jgi:Formyl transferase
MEPGALSRWHKAKRRPRLIPRTPGRSERAHTLRIGLLVDSTHVSKYEYDLAKWAQTEAGSLAITHLILHPVDREGFKYVLKRFRASTRSIGFFSSFYKFASHALFALIKRAEQRLLNSYDRHKDHFATFDISSLVSNKIVITPIMSKSMLVYRFDGKDVEKVRNLKLDLLIRCGHGILKGDILNAAALGIISFHHADNRINRGTPPGFWEVYRGEDTSGFTIQCLTEELDGGNVLMRGHFQTQWFFLLNQANLYERSNHYLKTLLTRIAEEGALPKFVPSVPYANGLYRHPTLFQCCYYTATLAGRLTAKVFRKFAGIRHQRNAAYTFTDWRHAVLFRGAKFEAGSSRDLAEPFVFGKDGQNICFLKEADSSHGKSRIVAYELCPDSSRRLGVAIEESFDLAFPFVFEHDGEILMCPETSEAGDIRIYRCVEFPLRWKLAKILMNNVSAAGTMLFERQAKWWMLTNIDPIAAGDHTSELSIFYADSPLSENWLPHRLNPIIVDASWARNAGLFMDGIGAFRVAQRQASDPHGKILSINEIINLTESQYEEKTVSLVTPDFMPSVRGTHHMHSDGKVTVFDFTKRGRIGRVGRPSGSRRRHPAVGTCGSTSFLAHDLRRP